MDFVHQGSNMIISDIFKVFENLQNVFPILPSQQHCEVHTGGEKGSKLSSTLS